MWALLAKSKIIFKKNILPEALGAIFSQQVHMYQEFHEHSRLTLDLVMDNVPEVGANMSAATIRSTHVSKACR